MKKRILLMCALLVSVITLSGAANRSFHTTLEQWNPIGFTQARSDSQITNRLTAGSAILPTVATAAPSGVLRGGSTNVITFKTSKKIGEKISLYMEYSGDTPTLSGANGTPDSGRKVTYTLTSQTVTITGNVTDFYCEKNQLTTLDVSQNTALTWLDCSDNQLTALYVSQNTALRRLDCSDNQLTALDVSKNTALTKLYCENNPLTALDLSQNTELTELACYNNQLTALDVSQNTALQRLICHDNKLTALNLSKNTKLAFLICRSNQLTALDVSKNTKLTYLSCSSNQLTALDVPKNTALTELDCSDNQLTALDVSRNTVLEKLYCYNNQLKALDVSRNTVLEKLYCGHNQLTALDVSKNTALTELHCYNNQLTALDVSKNTALTELYCYNNQIQGEEMTRLVNSLPDRTGKIAGTFIVVREPDLEGNSCLKSDVAIAKGKNWYPQKYNSDTYEVVDYEGEELSPYIMFFTTAKAVGETVELLMTYTGAAPTLSGATGTHKSGEYVTYKLTSQTVTIRGDVTVLFCSGNKLTTLDVSKNTALEKLDCSDNQLTALDVSKNTALTRLDCSDNQLTALDVSKNTALTGLFCYNNQLTALDVSKNTALTSLNCSRNQLTALDVSQNTALTELYCSNNQLKALDVSKNTALTNLDCFGNQIKGEEMTRLVNGLPDHMGMDAGEFAVVQEPSPEGNRCLKSDVAIAKRKNWNTQKYDSDTYDVVDYEGEEPIPYAVTLTKSGEGTLTATGAANLNAVPEGTELTIVATPADGYELKALTANGTDILVTKKFTVRANTEVKATFTKKTAADVVEAGMLHLYPNPASAYVNVKGAKADALVRLYDANGALRYEARTDADGTLQLNLSAYAEGTYLLRIEDDAQRLLIQR